MSDVAIAAPNEAAADAGEQVARAGGNAIDAALAASLVTMVNEVGIVSLSSGGFITVQPPGGSEAISTVDGWMDMPGSRYDRSGSFVAGRSTRPPDGGDGPSSFVAGRSTRPSDGGDAATWDVTTEYGGGVEITIGPGSVATHGAVAAFGEAHRRWGAVPWAEVVAPAIDVARRGFRLGSASRYYLEYVHESIYGWDEASRRAVHDLRPEFAGELTTEPIVVPDLAASLEQIAERGWSALHVGDLAALVADDVESRGGLLSRADLAAYRPVVREALGVRLGRWTLGTTPPPSVGGVCVAAMLQALDGSEGDDPAASHILVQRAVLGHRLDVLDHSNDLATEALAYLRELGVAVPERPASTAHVSASDGDGGSCAVTVSSGYGSGMVARGTGIWLNNCLGEQELNPRGLHASAPRSRLLSNMAPTVARHDDGASLAIGSPGADRISTAIAQVLGGFVLTGLSLQEAVNRPRVHVHRAGRADEHVKREDEPTMYFGGVGATLRRPVGGGSSRLEAAADPRRDGAVRLVRDPGAM